MLTRLRQENPQAIVFLGTIEDFIPFMKQYAEQGLKARLYTRSVSITDVLYRELGPLANGIHAGEPYFAEIPTNDNRDFVARFKSRWNREPITHAYTSYAAAQVLAQAVRVAGTDSPAQVREAMHKVRYKGVTGDITFDQGNQAYTNIYVGRVDCAPAPCRIVVIASTPSR